MTLLGWQSRLWPNTNHIQGKLHKIALTSDLSRILSIKHKRHSYIQEHYKLSINSK